MDPNPSITIEDVSSGPDDDDSVSGRLSITLSKRQKARALVSKVKARVKELPERVLEKAGRESTDEEEHVYLSDDPAFNPALVLDRASPKRTRGSSGDVGHKFKAVGNAIAHPVRAARHKATDITANRISRSQRPYLTAEQDLELLRAEENFARAASSASSAPPGTSAEEDSEAEAAHRRLQNIEENRASIKTAWAIGRHVVRVRVVQKTTQQPSRQDFFERDENGQQQRFQWEKWLAQLVLWYTRGFTSQYVDDFQKPPFDVQDLARTVERLTMVSAPWQNFVFEIRQVYLWHDKKRTVRWGVLFWFLWYTEHIVGFLYAYIIYMTIRNRYHPSSIESIRKTMQRSLDRQAQARAWGELIEKHGRTDWIEPLLEKLGPIIQMQLGDLANFIEVLMNFYRWERPRKTAATIFFFANCLLITLLADMRYCMKIVWFIVGGTFFFTWPLAARFPRYRFLVSVLRWVFWDIPTHAELGIIHLQEKAIMADAQDRKMHVSSEDNQPTPNADDSNYDTAIENAAEEASGASNSRVLSFRAYRGKTRGQLRIRRTSLHFEDRSHAIDIPFDRLREMRKVPVTRKRDRFIAFKGDSKGLEFDFQDADSPDVETLAIIVNRSERHKVFNYVLAWSNLKWQSLQLDRHSKGASRKDIEDALDEGFD